MSFHLLLSISAPYPCGFNAGEPLRRILVPGVWTEYCPLVGGTGTRRPTKVPIRPKNGWKCIYS